MSANELPSVAFVNSDLPDIIELRHVDQSYDGGKTFILQDVNLLIEDKPDQGQFIVILGPSGCGKSTLLRWIAGLQKPTNGEVLLHGLPRAESPLAVSMVFQQYSSLPWMSVLDNVKLPLTFRGEKGSAATDQAMAMIRRVGLAGHEGKYAQYPLLSGGQLQRVAIARSLISNPDIILMDEPFGALDTNTRYNMQILLAEIWESLESTVLFVTHDIDEAVFLGDDIYLMSANPGRIVKHIPVDLPFHRDRSTKRTPRFEELTHFVEDELLSLS